MVVTPTSGGTLQLKIPSTATLTDIAGNSLVVTPEIFDDKVINVTSGTTLTVGDILFTGMRVVDPDYFSFVLLKDVVDGTSLIVTDNRWTGTSLTVNEGNATFVVQNNGNGLKAGTHLVYESGRLRHFVLLKLARPLERSRLRVALRCPPLVIRCLLIKVWHLLIRTLQTGSLESIASDGIPRSPQTTRYGQLP